MDRAAKDSAEIKRLQRCMNDLLSLIALPAFWSGNEPSQIILIVLDALLGMLSLDFVYARLESPGEAASVELLRMSESWRLKLPAPEICSVLRIWFQDEAEKPFSPVRKRLWDEDISVIPVPLGINGGMGTIVAASERASFPEQTESLLLSVAANQATVGLHEARLLTAQKQLAMDLDRRVAERTVEVATTNQELRREIVERALVEARLRHEEQEVKQKEEALAKARSELAKMVQITSLGVLTASIAHEINQPLSGIVTNASTCLRMLSADPPNIDGARETVRRTIRDGNRAADVITRLRALYSKKEPSPEFMDLNEAAREVTALSMSELQRSTVVLREELEDDLPSVFGDRVQLQQVIFNLLRNAADAMRTVEDRPRELTLRTRRDGENRVQLSVKDAGVGITPQAAEKIFDAFYTTKSDGMGIGLSVSRSIIEAHQGRLWATANDGPGCTFWFAIPCNPQALADGEPGLKQADSSADAA